MNLISKRGDTACETLIGLVVLGFVFILCFHHSDSKSPAIITITRSNEQKIDIGDKVYIDYLGKTGIVNDISIVSGKLEIITDDPLHPININAKLVKKIKIEEQ